MTPQLRVYTIVTCKQSGPFKIETLLIHVMAGNPEHAWQRVLESRLCGHPIAMFEGAHLDLRPDAHQVVNL